MEHKERMLILSSIYDSVKVITDGSHSECNPEELSLLGQIFEKLDKYMETRRDLTPSPLSEGTESVYYQHSISIDSDSPKSNLPTEAKTILPGIKYTIRSHPSYSNFFPYTVNCFNQIPFNSLFFNNLF